MGLPVIKIDFKQLAAEAIKRSQQGIVGLFVRESSKDWVRKEYRIITDVQADDFTNSLAMVKDCFDYTPYKVVVFNLGSGTIEDALKQAAKERLNWLGLAYQDEDGEDTKTLQSWIKTMRKEGFTYKAILYKAVQPDNMGIVNFANDTVTFADARGTKEGWEYIPTLLGILAGMPMTRGATNFVCGNLVDCSDFSNINEEIDQGFFCLLKKNGKVKVGRGNNSLVELTQDLKEDMQDIAIVEAMDLIRDDIHDTFDESWSGKWKNSTDNQILLATTINAYFEALANETVLDNKYNNRAEIDAEAIRLAWKSVGKTQLDDGTPIEDATEDQLINLPFKKKALLKANIKILNIMEDFYFPITMF